MRTDDLIGYSLNKWKGKTINGVLVSDNPTTAELESIVHHYEADGYIVDLDTYNSYTTDKQIVNIMQYEFAENEERRKIKLIDRKYIALLSVEFDDKMKKIKTTRSKNKIETTL